MDWDDGEYFPDGKEDEEDKEDDDDDDDDVEDDENPLTNPLKKSSDPFVRFRKIIRRFRRRRSRRGGFRFRRLFRRRRGGR